MLLLALLATLAYALHESLLSKHIRERHLLVVIGLRSLICALVLGPVIYFSNVSLHLENFPFVYFIIGALLGFIGFIFHSLSLKHLKVGLANSFNDLLSMVIVVGLSLYLFQESLSTAQIFTVLLLLLLSTDFFWPHLKEKGHTDNRNLRGLAWSAISAVCYAGSLLFFVQTTKLINPLMAIFFWAATYAVFSGIGILVLRLKPAQIGMKAREIPQMVLITLPFILADALYASTISTGSLISVTVVMALYGCFVSIFGYLIHGENLSLREWAVVSASCLLLGCFEIFA